MVDHFGGEEKMALRFLRLPFDLGAGCRWVASGGRGVERGNLSGRWREPGSLEEKIYGGSIKVGEEGG